DTCYGTHHLQFATDADNTLWTSGGGNVIGWLNTRVFLETGDAAKAQGWTPLVLDYNGNGRRDAYAEPDQTPTEAQDQRINAGFYAVMPNPADGSVWGSAVFRYPGAILRLEPGSNPPETALTEIYNVPLPGFGVRGADIDANGVAWVSLGSGHLGEFDRRKCQGPLNGPDATGDHCPEGWTFHRLPGPGFPGLEYFSVESSYYTWVDQHNTSGLGENTPIATGNLFDGVHALVGGRFVTLRIPYPLGFYAKGLEGRIDEPDAGWKGRGLWIASGDRTPWLKEGGKGTKPLVVHFQVRPDPLAK
ncbi:MAG TPA: carboxypeptidase regulatory-like domain-containing protein, partial [Gammaproteobacteria bacterium]|nr:carboxypeptidase regulatory-like domain-containing protein [Gammaproteobacteria bacterium]